MKKIIVLIMFFVFSSASSAITQKFPSFPLIQETYFGAIVDGRWAEVKGTGTPILVRINCETKYNFCYVAEVHVIDGETNLFLDYYEIKHADEKGINATVKRICGQNQIIIDLINKKALKVEAAPAETNCNEKDIKQYYLK